MRVSADLDPQTWGSLDRYADDHGMTRAQAVEHAVKRLVEDYEGQITGLGQMAVLHPSMRRKGKAS